jgi:hypothetical protein
MRLFNQKVKSSTCFWWHFCVFRPTGVKYDAQATDRSVPEGGGGGWDFSLGALCFQLVVWESYMTPSHTVMDFFSHPD